MCSYGIWTRTRTNRTKICCAAITPFHKVLEIRYYRLMPITFFDHQNQPYEYKDCNGDCHRNPDWRSYPPPRPVDYVAQL